MLKLSEVVFKVVESKTGCLYWEEHVEFDMTFEEAVEEAYLLLEKCSDEDAPPSLHWVNETKFEIGW